MFAAKGVAVFVDFITFIYIPHRPIFSAKPFRISWIDWRYMYFDMHYVLQCMYYSVCTTVYVLQCMHGHVSCEGGMLKELKANGKWEED